MEDVAEAGEVVARADGLGQGEDALEHGGDHVHVGDPVFLHRGQPELRVELLHQHDGHAGGQGLGDIEGQGGGVVGGAAAHVDVVGGIVPLLGARSPLGRHHDGAGAIDTLGPAGGAGGVHHSRAVGGVQRIGVALGGQGGLVGVEPVDLAADGQLEHQAVVEGGDGGVREVRMGDEGLGLTVADDIGRLRRAEVPVDRRQPGSAAQIGGQDLDELRGVGAQQGDMVARPYARPAKGGGQAVGVAVQLAEGPSPARRVHRHGVRFQPGVEAGQHALFGQRHDPGGIEASKQVSHGRFPRRFLCRRLKARRAALTRGPDQSAPAVKIPPLASWSRKASGFRAAARSRSPISSGTYQ